MTPLPYRYVLWLVALLAVLGTLTFFVGPYLPTTWMRGWIAVAKGRREDDEGLLYGCDMCNATGKGRMSKEGDTTCWQRLMED